MPTFKNVSGYDLWVPSLVKTVKDGETVDVADGDVESWNQPGRWESPDFPVEAPAPAAPVPADVPAETPADGPAAK